MIFHPYPKGRFIYKKKFGLNNMLKDTKAYGLI
jgi:hypothetical protein